MRFYLSKMKVILSESIVGDFRRYVHFDLVLDDDTHLDFPDGRTLSFKQIPVSERKNVETRLHLTSNKREIAEFDSERKIFGYASYSSGSLNFALAINDDDIDRIISMAGDKCNFIELDIMFDGQYDMSSPRHYITMPIGHDDDRAEFEKYRAVTDFALSVTTLIENSESLREFKKSEQIHDHLGIYSRNITKEEKYAANKARNIDSHPFYQQTRIIIALLVATVILNAVALIV